MCWQSLSVAMTSKRLEERENKRTLLALQLAAESFIVNDPRKGKNGQHVVFTVGFEMPVLS